MTEEQTPEELDETDGQVLSGVQWLIHDSPGRILRYGVAPDEAGALLQVRSPGEHLMLLPEGAEIDDETHWVNQGALAIRPQLAFSKIEITADGLEAAVMTGLPDPCTILVDGEEHEIIGGSIELTTTMPATYHIVIEDPFPAQPFEGEVVAHAP